jgi:purine-binding chemotaxis protein CheW
MTPPEPEAKESTQASAERDQYLAFRVAGEAYAVEISEVREIITFRRPTQVPMTPAHVMGVINLRGGVVPLIDLALKFGLAETAVSKRTCIIIVDVALSADVTVMGIVVDAVSAVIEVSAGEIEQAPSFGVAVRAEYLRGMARIGDRFLPILDLGFVLASDDLAATLASGEGEAALADER